MNAVVHWPTTGGRQRFAQFGRAALCTFASRAASFRSARIRFAVCTPLCASPNDVIKLTAKTASTTLDSGWCSNNQSLVLEASEYSGTLSKKAPTCAAVRAQFTFRCKNCGTSSSLRNVRPMTGLCSRTLAAVATFLTANPRYQSPRVFCDRREALLYLPSLLQPSRRVDLTSPRRGARFERSGRE